MMSKRDLGAGSRTSPASEAFTRKEFLSALMVAPLALGATSCDSGQVASGGDDVGRAAASAEENVDQRVARVIREYDAHGIHRTGTEGDQACARWLADEARALGVPAQLEGLPFSRIDVQECFVEVGGHRVEGVPLFDGTFTDGDGLSGTLGPADEDSADIGLVQISPDNAGGEAFQSYRRGTAHRAVIAVTGGEQWGLPPGFALANAESYRDPYGPPTLQLPSEALAILEPAAEGRAQVRVVSHVVRSEVEVFNTTAILEGRFDELAPLVIMTPRSGWWECASERGGGIALWVEMMAALKRARPARTVHFVASTGHELGHYGLEDYLQTRRELIERAVAWVHLGANFGAAVGPDVLFQFSDAEIRNLTLEALAELDLAPDQETPIGDRAFGEARNIFDGGGRYLSILGRNGLFHHPADRWPEAVDVAKVVGFARALSQVAVELTRA